MDKTELKAALVDLTKEAADRSHDAFALGFRGALAQAIPAEHIETWIKAAVANGVVPEDLLATKIAAREKLVELGQSGIEKIKGMISGEKPEGGALRSLGTAAGTGAGAWLGSGLGAAGGFGILGLLAKRGLLKPKLRHNLTPAARSTESIRQGMNKILGFGLGGAAAGAAGGGLAGYQLSKQGSEKVALLGAIAKGVGKAFAPTVAGGSRAFGAGARMGAAARGGANMASKGVNLASKGVGRLGGMAGRMTSGIGHGLGGRSGKALTGAGNWMRRNSGKTGLGLVGAGTAAAAVPSMLSGAPKAPATQAPKGPEGDGGMDPYQMMQLMQYIQYMQQQQGRQGYGPY